MGQGSSLFREPPAPSFFGEPVEEHAATTDPIFAGICIAFAALWIGLVLIAPSFIETTGKSGKRPMIYYLIFVTVSMLMGFTALGANWGSSWIYASATSHVPYSALIDSEINAKIEVFVQLRGVNITLDADEASEQALGQKIFFNEHFNWQWDQGRLGFGRLAGQINQDFRREQQEGTPKPILDIVEYFTPDQDFFRWGRHYRLAGYYTSIIMWMSLVTWFGMNVLTLVNLKYGGYMSMWTGGWWMAAVLTYDYVLKKQFLDLKIPFPEEELDVTRNYGWTFWWVVAGTVLAFVWGFALVSIGRAMEAARVQKLAPNVRIKHRGIAGNVWYLLTRKDLYSSTDKMFHNVPRTSDLPDIKTQKDRKVSVYTEEDIIAVKDISSDSNSGSSELTRSKYSAGGQRETAGTETDTDHYLDPGLPIGNGLARCNSYQLDDMPVNYESHGHEYNVPVGVGLVRSSLASTGSDSLRPRQSFDSGAGYSHRDSTTPMLPR
eukprot:Clim_evm4s151 gene=Clim_evmTU4s151